VSCGISLGASEHARRTQAARSRQASAGLRKLVRLSQRYRWEIDERATLELGVVGTPRRGHRANRRAQSSRPASATRSRSFDAASTCRLWCRWHSSVRPCSPGRRGQRPTVGAELARPSTAPKPSLGTCARQVGRRATERRAGARARGGGPAVAQDAGRHPAGKSVSRSRTTNPVASSPVGSSIGSITTSALSAKACSQARRTGCPN
jgi:hypothetical protein